MPKDRTPIPRLGVFALSPVRPEKLSKYRQYVKEESISPLARLSAPLGPRLRRPAWKLSNNKENHDRTLDIGNNPFIELASRKHALEVTSTSKRNLESTSTTGSQTSGQYSRHTPGLPDNRSSRFPLKSARMPPKATQCYKTRNLDKADRIIGDLKAQVLALQRSESRLKKQAGQRAETLRDIKGDARGNLLLLVEAESKLEEVELALQREREEANRYRTWWLTEYHSLKAVIELIPRRHDVDAIASSSQARFSIYEGTVDAPPQ